LASSFDSDYFDIVVSKVSVFSSSAAFFRGDNLFSEATDSIFSVVALSIFLVGFGSIGGAMIDFISLWLSLSGLSEAN